MPDADDEAARAHFRVGQSLYDAGRFRESAEEWEKAYALSGRAELLYNVYVAYRDATDLPNAIDALRRYLHADEDLGSGERLNLQRRLEAMETRYAAWQAQQGARQAEQPDEGIPGPASAEPADEAAPRPVAEPEAPPGVQAGETHGRRFSTSAAELERPNLLPWVVVGAGGALLVAGTITGILTLHQSDELETDCPDGRCSPAFHDDLDATETLATVTDVLLIGGGLIAVGGLAWALWDGMERSDAASAPSHAPRASLACSTTGCQGTVSVRY